MSDIPITHALLLWNDGRGSREPGFAVRPLGHDDYDRFTYKVGACFRTWQDETNPDRLKLMLMIEAWHIVAFHGLPAEMVHEGLLMIPEYRSTLADDCLPNKCRHEREA